MKYFQVCFVLILSLFLLTQCGRESPSLASVKTGYYIKFTVLNSYSNDSTEYIFEEETPNNNNYISYAADARDSIINVAGTIVHTHLFEISFAHIINNTGGFLPEAYLFFSNPSIIVDSTNYVILPLTSNFNEYPFTQFGLRLADSTEYLVDNTSYSNIGHIYFTKYENYIGGEIEGEFDFTFVRYQNVNGIPINSSSFNLIKKGKFKVKLR